MMGRPPMLSVVVVSFNGPRLLGGCLASLAPQMTAGDVEVVAVRAWPDLTDGHAALVRDFPAVAWVTAPAGTTVPVMRRMGIRASHGEIVALLEDDCVVAPDWCQAVVTAHRETADVAIGGAVEPGPYRRGRDWAVFFCEYGRFMPPLPERPTTDLPGNNVSYKREVLETLPATPEGFYDVFVHRQWAEEGRPLRANAALVIRQMNTWGWRHVTAVPFHHGRAFGGMRLQHSPWPIRIAAGILALFLPLLSTARIVRIVLGRRRHLGHLARALPWIGLFTASWSLGESAGYLGGPGDSPARWR
jgi:hypothetical protein